ncbi:MAG: metallophosphoesterase [Chitinivibrionales bacterium]|nr:metallophosphoesterase [Chitinivibrionales bacterium]
MKAFISDIHANLEALKSVFKDIDSQHVDEIICLGDVVGYGPDPEPCTDLVMSRSDIALMGNHDYALLHGPLSFNPIAAEVIRITREKMAPARIKAAEYLSATESGQELPSSIQAARSHKEEQQAEQRWHFLETLPASLKDNNLSYVHASPLEPIHEYIFPDIYSQWWQPERIQLMFEKIDWLVFCGHTHYPCVITESMDCYYPQDSGNILQIEKDRKYIINDGSVGQPRDRDNRACYLLFDEQNAKLEWRRVGYNIESVKKKVDKMCGEDNWCGVRLRFGR